MFWDGIQRALVGKIENIPTDIRLDCIILPAFFFSFDSNCINIWRSQKVLFP
jgi:hypothetical protein